MALGSHTDLSGDVPTRHFPGAFILPGLRDAHIHPVGYAATLRGATLASAIDFDDVVTRLRGAAAPDSTVPVIGMRLNEETLTEKALPTRKVLDRAVSDRPAIVHRYCGHVAIVNSAALHLAGIDAGTPDPPGGTIDRDTGGNPTGVLRETAIEMVSEQLGTGNEVSPDELLDALRRLAAVGITSIGAILRNGRGTWASLGNEVDIAIAAAQRAPIKIGAYVIEESGADVAITKGRIDAAAPRLRWLGIKRFGDGSFGGHTAAMHEPFIDVPSLGTLRLGGLDREITTRSIALGGGSAVHAIGDRACSAVLDMFAELIAGGADPRRLRIEHASVLDAAEVARMAELGVVAVVQPPFLGSEAGWLVHRLGAQRLQHTYPFATMAAAGITLAGSSDSPVESPDPWAGMALARDRAGMVPEQGLTAAEALAAYTDGGAKALLEPSPLGEDSPADFIVVDRDPLAVSPTELRDTQVLATYVDGVEVAVDRTKPLWLD